eukprot:3420753-Alexandrium_andersonii.AAC.1
MSQRAWLAHERQVRDCVRRRPPAVAPCVERRAARWWKNEGGPPLMRTVVGRAALAALSPYPPRVDRHPRGPGARRFVVCAVVLLGRRAHTLAGALLWQPRDWRTAR